MRQTDFTQMGLRASTIRLPTDNIPDLLFLLQVDLNTFWQVCQDWQITAQDISEMKSIYEEIKGNEVLGMTAMQMQVNVKLVLEIQ